MIGALFQGPPFGTGIFTAALILAIMILPFIAATMRDVFSPFRGIQGIAPTAVGCTTWEVMRSIVLPYTRISVVGGDHARASAARWARRWRSPSSSATPTGSPTSPVRPGQHHRLARGAGVPRERDRQPQARVAAGAGLPSVRDLVHRPRHLAPAAAAPDERVTRRSWNATAMAAVHDAAAAPWAPAAKDAQAAG